MPGVIRVLTKIGGCSSVPSPSQTEKEGLNLQKIRYVLEKAPQGEGWVALDTETGHTYPRTLLGCAEVSEAMDLVRELNQSQPQIPVPTVENADAAG